jgi:hypothetical protein
MKTMNSNHASRSAWRRWPTDLLDMTLEDLAELCVAHLLLIDMPFSRSNVSSRGTRSSAANSSGFCSAITASTTHREPAATLPRRPPRIHRELRRFGPRLPADPSRLDQDCPSVTKR